MTCIQQVHWELDMDYLGHPYYVSGNAIHHALGLELDRDIHQAISASHGMFVPGQLGRFPEEHSESGARPYMGSSLPDVVSYDDLFLFRHSDHPWLLDSRARDGLNAHDIRIQSGMPALAHETIMGRPAEARTEKKTTKWYVNAYLHADDPEMLPLGEAVLDGLQFGGKRNYGYGTTRLKDTQVVDLEALDYSRLADAEYYLIKLVTPFVVETEYPGADDDTVPWWWNIGHDDRLRRREEQLVDQRETYRLDTIDHGQVVRYGGETPIKTAKNGIVRVGTHRRYGFGEFRVKPVADRVAQRSVYRK